MTVNDGMIASGQRSKRQLVRRTLHSIVRFLAWLFFCTLGIGIHHSWYGIGKVGMWRAGLDGAFLAIWAMVMIWIYGRIYKSNNGVTGDAGGGVP